MAKAVAERHLKLAPVTLRMLEVMVEPLQHLYELLETNEMKGLGYEQFAKTEMKRRQFRCGATIVPGLRVTAFLFELNWQIFQ